MKMASGGKVPPEILSTHPSNQRRINDLTYWIPKAKKRASEINKN
jgi:Zn-dependent protease with chaperone function